MADPIEVEAEAVGRVVHRLDKGLLRGGQGLIGAAFLTTVMAAVYPGLSPIAWALIVLALFPLGVHTVLTRKRTFPTSGPLRVTDHALAIPWQHGSVVVKSESIRSVALATHGISIFDDQEVEWVVRLSEEEELRLVDRLDPGPTGPAVRFRQPAKAGTISQLVVLFGGCAFIAAISASMSITIAFLISALLAMSWFRRVKGQTAVEIGADGVTIDGRFIAHERIRRVDAEEDRLLLSLGDETLELRLPDDPALRAMIVSRLTRVRREQQPRALDIFDRKGESLEDWTLRVRTAASDHRDYRSVPVRVAQIEESVLDPNAPPDRRLGAALALRVASPDSFDQIISDATKACANPDLTELFELLAEDDLTDLKVQRFVASRRLR